MNREAWERALRHGLNPVAIGRLAVSDTWNLPAYIGEAGRVPAWFLAQCAVEGVSALAAWHRSKRTNPYQCAALTIVGSSAYLERVDDADPRTIVMVIRGETNVEALADCIAFSNEGAAVAELARITRTVRSLDAMGKRWGKA